MNIKTCPKCGIEKPFSEYHKDSARKLGVQVYCKLCKATELKKAPSVVNDYHQKYRATEKYKKWYSEWKNANRVKINLQRKVYRSNRRIEAFKHYGLQCACCGESELTFLAIDHIDGGGRKHRKSLGADGGAFYSWLRKENYPPGFQTLCHNCNWAKHVLGKCPHQK